MTLQPGSSIGTYEILAAIGKGGMGEVYRARDSKLKRDVAIKSLRRCRNFPHYTSSKLEAAEIIKVGTNWKQALRIPLPGF